MTMEYDTFVDDPNALLEGEVAIAIRELSPEDRRTKYKTRYVKAQISSSPDKIPGGDILRLRWQRGRLYPEPWAIKILEELGEFMPKRAASKT